MNGDTSKRADGYMQVLIVDGDKTRLDHSEETFQVAGYQVLRAADGNECLKIARSKRPDLILIDAGLSDISGIDLIREIKRDSNLSDAWAVLWFSPGMESMTRARALERGADACLERALPTRELLARIEAMVRRRRDEEILRDTLRQWRGIFDVMAHAVYLVDTENRIIDCNLALGRLLSKPRGEIIGQNCYELMHGTRQPLPSCAHQQALQSGQMETLILPILDRWLMLTVTPLFDADDKPIGTVHVACDITEQRRGEQELRQSLEQLQARMSETQTALERTTEQLRDQTEGRQAAEEALSQAHTKLEKQAQEHMAAFDRVQQVLQDEKAERQRLEEELARAQTEVAHGQQAEESLSQLRAEMTTLAETHADLEEQSKAHREALAKASEALQKAVAKRKQAEKSLSEAQVSLDDTEQALHAEAEAVRLEKEHRMEAIGLLAGGVAQQFNELLADILGSAEVGLSQLEPSYPAYGELTSIQRAARRGTEWTRRLSTIQRKELVQPQALDLNELITRLMKVLRRLTSRDADLELKLATELPGVLGDADALERLLMNLVENAQVMMPEGGVLSIETAQVAVDETHAHPHQGVAGEYVRLRVADTGPAIEDQVRERLFEPFFLAAESDQGVGLKMAEAYSVVRQHGGWIEVETQPDQGNRFDIYLPVSEM